MKPKLRRLEFIPVEENGEEWYFVRDPQGLSPEVSLPCQWGPLLARLDGEHEIDDLVEELNLQEANARDWLGHVIQELDENLLLDSPHYALRRGEIMQEYAQAATRPAHLAGGAYPAEADKLGRVLNGYFDKAAALNAPEPCYKPSQLRGIMVPHIDFHRGGAVEALAYQRLRQTEFDLLITFGIAHSGVQYPFCATAQDFETPLGVQKTDKEFVQALQARVGERLTAEQWAHKNEHSVEFVAVFLQACEESKTARFVPILCGGFFNELRSGKSPSTNKDVAQFCTALRELIEERRAQGQRVGFIASVDLAHVGPNFDHPYPITPKRKLAIEKLDREALSHLETGEIEGFHDALAADANARHVDAHPAVYTLMHAFPELRAQLLHYAQAPAPEESIVSFASMAFYEDLA
jgi:hypothetical protein